MEKIPVEIISPTQAKELNPLGEKPVYPSFEVQSLTHQWESRRIFNELTEAWQTAESQRRVWEIENAMELENRTILGKSENGWVDFDFYEIGSIHTAEIVNEKEVIIK